MVDLILAAIPAFILLGTVEPEGERVRYGLTKNLATFNPFHVAFHEYGSIWQDLRRSPRWRDRIGFVFGGPGWVSKEPSESEATR